jgi:hypothetical protein
MISKYVSTDCVIVDLITKTENENVISLWSEIFDTSDVEEVVSIIKENLTDKDQECTFKDVDSNLISEQEFRLSDLTFIDIESVYLKALEASNKEGYLKIIIRSGTYLRDNLRVN